MGSQNLTMIVILSLFVWITLCYRELVSDPDQETRGMHLGCAGRWIHGFPVIRNNGHMGRRMAWADRTAEKAQEPRSEIQEISGRPLGKVHDPASHHACAVWLMPIRVWAAGKGVCGRLSAAVEWTRDS